MVVELTLPLSSKLCVCVALILFLQSKRHLPPCLQEKHELLRKLQPALAQPLHPHDFVAELCSQLAPGQTLCTEESENGGGESGGGSSGVREREGRPALVVSSTSWTPDEDFGLLLKAAEVRQSS